MLIAQSRGEAASARTEAAQARAEAADARSDVVRGPKRGRRRARRGCAGVRRGGQAVAQRDAAIDRAKEVAADREAMLNQFKVLSAETLDRQGTAADAQAEVRLKATEQLMAPVRESLESSTHGSPRSRRSVSLCRRSCASQVSYVQQTGETLRRETAALVTASASRRSVGPGARPSSSGWPSSRA